MARVSKTYTGDGNPWGLASARATSPGVLVLPVDGDGLEFSARTTRLAQPTAQLPTLPLALYALESHKSGKTAGSD